MLLPKYLFNLSVPSPLYHPSVKLGQLPTASNCLLYVTTYPSLTTSPLSTRVLEWYFENRNLIMSLPCLKILQWFPINRQSHSETSEALYRTVPAFLSCCILPVAPHTGLSGFEIAFFSAFANVILFDKNSFLSA